MKTENVTLSPYQGSFFLQQRGAAAEIHNWSNCIEAWNIYNAICILKAQGTSQRRHRKTLRAGGPGCQL